MSSIDVKIFLGWLPMMLHSKTEKESQKRHGPVMCACQLVVRKQCEPKTLDICGVQFEEDK